MPDQEIENKVKQIIVDELGVDENEVTPNARFIDDLGADSLDTVELVMRFEERRKDPKRARCLQLHRPAQKVVASDR
jgi:hypothetical protein